MEKRCRHCGQPFIPRKNVAHQEYCSTLDCQSARKSQWRKRKLLTDPDYRDTNRYSVPEKLVGKEVEVHKLWDRIEIFWKNQKVADHQRLIDKRETRITAKGHHPPLNRQKAHRGPCPEEVDLRGHAESLDLYVGELKRRLLQYRRK